MDLLVLLATEEGVPPEHIASTIVPIVGALIFCGSVYILLWSIYGAKKGALVYGSAFSAFGMMIGVFWWFGAPGTPIATGLTYFPGQPNDAYVGKWFPMEPGSERADAFEVTQQGLDAFQTPAEWVGAEGLTPQELEQNPAFRSLAGDLSSAVDAMLGLYLPSNEAGTPLIGSQRRDRLETEAGAPPEGRRRATPFYSARVKPLEEGSDDPTAFLAEDRGLMVVAAPLQIVATYVNADPDAAPDPQQVVVEEQVWFAFKDPGAIWFPSAVWTAAFGIIFLLCLFGLDRIEQREKARVREREPVAA